MNLKSTITNGFNFPIINSLMDFFWGGGVGGEYLSPGLTVMRDPASVAVEVGSS